MRNRCVSATSISNAHYPPGLIIRPANGLKKSGFLLNMPFSTSRNSRASIRPVIRFRPCIDIHKGKVKQIVGSTLRDLKEDGTNPLNNFESDKKSAAEYTNLHKVDELTGGHVIMLGADPLSKYAALEALRAYPGVNSQPQMFGLKQMRAATDDFNLANKIGEGGFGPVYKGQLSDGTKVAVKKLSLKSKQGGRQFLNEIDVLCHLQHPNLVKLHGFCKDGNQLLLVYEYLENNSLAQVLFDTENQIKLHWPTRVKICIGIARGIGFLHEGSELKLKIVHRDIKAHNVLLDKNLNPKISDLGLAKLIEEEDTHTTTHPFGTWGYIAPEVVKCYLTDKADVYSFGVVVFELINGKSNNRFIHDNCVSLIDWARHLHRTGNLMEMVDERLGSEVNPNEAEAMVKIALLCTNELPSVRPRMSQVVNMLEGRASIPEVNF